MSDHDDEHHDETHGDAPAGEDHRITSPMQSFTTSQVGTGLVVLVVGLVVVFGVPLLLG